MFTCLHVCMQIIWEVFGFLNSVSLLLRALHTHFCLSQKRYASIPFYNHELNRMNTFRSSPAYLFAGLHAYPFAGLQVYVLACLHLYLFARLHANLFAGFLV